MKRSLVASLVAAGAFSVGGIALAAGTLQFRSTLETENEIPTPVNVVGDPGGDLKLKLSPDGQELRYDLKITSPITNMFMAHLHAERNPNRYAAPINNINAIAHPDSNKFPCAACDSNAEAGGVGNSTQDQSIRLA